VARALASVQSALFGTPHGLLTRTDFVTPEEAAGLLSRVATLPFRPFEYQGWLGKRETVSFGWRYDFNQARVEPAPPIPDFLLPLRERAAAFAGLAPAAFEQALVIRYGIGAGLGWHRDRPQFDRVFGLSLQSDTVLRFRRRTARGFERFALDAPARSAYLLSGEIRHEWEHSLVPVTEPRFSITFRSRAVP
jgi:alkylated DNA repair protein (DNA oxidative demethylase)